MEGGAGRYITNTIYVRRVSYIPSQYLGLFNDLRPTTA